MSRHLLCDRKALLHKIEALNKLGKPERNSPTVQEALAEAHFRYAVHADTPFDEALASLAWACRIDGTNPKYAYHLGRLHFIHGQFESAGTWLRTAAQLCPTSHRIWTHISMLQRELNAIYAGNSKYEPDALKVRADRIVEKIRNGQDQFEADLFNYSPPISRAFLEEKARKERESQKSRKEDDNALLSETSLTIEYAERLLDKGRCRWSGVIDQEMENALEDSSSERNRDKLIPLFNALIERAAAKPDKSSALAVLGIDWLLLGYPPPFIGRLLERFPEYAARPSFKLMHAVLDLYKMPEDQLPGALAKALENDEIPPLIGAMIHRQRLLWQPLEFNYLVSYRAARAFLRLHGNDGKTDEEPDLDSETHTHLKNAQNILKLLQPKTPEAMKDSQGPQEIATLDGESAATTLQQYEEAGEAVRSFSAAAYKYLKDGIEPALKAEVIQTSGPQASADLKALDAIVQALEQTADRGLKRIEKYQQQVKGIDPKESPENLGPRLEKCRNDFVEVAKTGNFKKVMKRLQAQVAASGLEANGKSLEPGEGIHAILRDIRAIFSGDGEPVETLSAEACDGESAAVTAAPAAEDVQENGGDTLDQLAQTLAAVDDTITEMFATAKATFAKYPFGVRQLYPIRLLAQMVAGREAETLYRMGQRKKARSIWNNILQQDRLNLGVLKNIAICDSQEPDIGAGLRAWQSYCDMLYYRAIIAGDPGHLAKERADFHRDFANAYAPAYLEGKLDGEWRGRITDESVISFFNSPGRLASYFEHKLLEIFNRKLMVANPSLVLGVERSDTRERREHAQQVLEKFTEEVLAVLSPDLSHVFTKLCKAHFQRALDYSIRVENLSLKSDPNYDKEYPVQLQWVTDICHLIFKFIVLIHSEESVAHAAANYALIEQLDRLSEIPADLSDKMLTSAALSLQTHTPEALYETFTNLKKTLLRLALKNMFTIEESETMKRRRAPYQMVVEHWVERPLMADYLSYLDDPQDGYSEVIRAALEDKGDPAAAEAELAVWCTYFPRSTGPARWRAHLLVSLQRGEEAIEVLNKAREHAFYDKGREECDNMLGTLNVQDGLRKKDFAASLAAVKKVMLKDTSKPEQYQQLSGIYLQWIQAEPGKAAELEMRIQADFDWWLEQVGASLTDEMRQDIINDRRRLQVRAALAPFGELNDTAPWQEIVAEMDHLIEMDLDHLEAIHMAMVGHYRLAAQAASGGDASVAKEQLRSAGQWAERILAESQDKNQLDFARSIKQQLGKMGL